MRLAVTCAFACLILLLVFGCSEGRLTEEEYVSRAKEMLDAGNIEDAIYNYQSLVKYYTESEDIEAHKEKLLELLLEGGEKFAGTPKGDTYMAEALNMVEGKGDSLVYWVKFKTAVNMEKSDANAAAQQFEQIPIEGYSLAAQMAMVRGNIEESNAAYEKLIEIYPENPENYKWMFMIGFNYSEYIKDTVKAREVFEQIVEKYPECDLADDAEWMIENMGKPLEEMDFADIADTVESKEN